MEMNVTNTDIRNIIIVDLRFIVMNREGRKINGQTIIQTGDECDDKRCPNG
jgi:hypothetical protein